MAPKYKLTYFDHRGRAELSRLLFTAAKVPFEDYRIPVIDDFTPDPIFAEIKKKAPFGEVPFLEVDGKQLCQSHAIERFLASEFGLAGETSFEKAEVDMWLEASEEILSGIVKLVDIVDSEKRKEEATKLQTGGIARVFGRLEEELADKADGFIVGKKLSAADLAFISVKDWMRNAWGHEGLMIMAQYPAVLKHVRRMSALPTIAEYLRTRPFTDY